jgi:hypothetical protein
MKDANSRGHTSPYCPALLVCSPDRLRMTSPMPFQLLFGHMAWSTFRRDIQKPSFKMRESKLEVGLQSLIPDPFHHSSHEWGQRIFDFEPFRILPH